MFIFDTGILLVEILLILGISIFITDQKSLIEMMEYLEEKKEKDGYILWMLNLIRHDIWISRSYLVTFYCILKVSKWLVSYYF